jgi:hypothetical protein
MHTTKPVINAVPNENLDYQPDSKSKTGLGLVRHLTLEDEWLLNSIADGAFAPPPDDSDVCGIMNSAEAVARYQVKVPAALDRIRAMSGEQLGNVIDLFGMVQARGSRPPAPQFPRDGFAHSKIFRLPGCRRWPAPRRRI